MSTEENPIDLWIVEFRSLVEMGEIYPFRTEKEAREMAQELMLLYQYEDKTVGWKPIDENTWTMGCRAIKVLPLSYGTKYLQSLKESHMNLV